MKRLGINALLYTFLLTSMCIGKIALCNVKRPDGSTSKQQANFKYIIFKNELIHNGRLVFVLLDEKSFSEETLKELCYLISKRFPSPVVLNVAIFSNLEQIPTPEEEDRNLLLPSEEQIIPKELYNYPSAVYTRNASDEFLTLSLVSPNRSEKRITLKKK